MIGKQAANYQEARKLLYAEYVLVLVPTNDNSFPGFQTIIRDDALNATAMSTEGFWKTSPPELFEMFVLSPNPPKCYLVEDEAEAIVQKLRDAGHEIEFEE